MIGIQLDPHSDESLHGFFQRHAQALGLPDAKSFLRAASVKPRVSYTPEQLSSLACNLQLNAERLESKNPSATHTDPVYNLRFQRSKLSPVCPLCIAEKSYCRAAWDHDLVTACALHGNYLIDRCDSCGECISRDRGCFHSCELCGFDLRKTTLTPATTGDLAISALLVSAKATARMSLPEPLSAGPAPADLGSFLNYLAKYIQSSEMPADGTPPVACRKAQRPKDLDASKAEVQRIWSVLENWPINFESFMREKIQSGTGRSVSTRVGKWLNIFYREFGSDQYQFFSDAISRTLSEHFDGHLERFFRSNHLKRTHVKEWYTANEVASALNSSPGLVTAAVEEGRLEGQVHEGALRYVTVHRSVIEAIKQERSNYLTESEARSFLGISKPLLERLVHAGCISETIKSQIPPLVQGKFHLPVLRAYQQRLLDNVQPRRISDKHLIGLQDICAKRGLNEAQLAAVYVDISEGRLAAVKRVSGPVGVAGLRFDVREVKEHLASESHEPMLLKYDLVNYGGWKADDVTAWIKGGFLEVRREKRGNKWVEMVPLSSLTKFMTQYLVLSDASRSLETTTNYLLKTLQPAKIAAATSPTSGRRPARGLLVETKELIRGAQLRKASLKELADRHCRSSLEGSSACGP